MTRAAPLYVPVERIAPLKLRHKWSDDDPFKPLAQPGKEIQALLRKVSNRGITTFALGCAEWVLYRFSRHVEDPTPDYYIEAFWVFVMGRDEALPPATEHDDWLGRVRGAVNLSLMTVLNTVLLSEEGPPVKNGAFSSVIAEHVLAPEEIQASFHPWRDKVLKRLLRHAPRDPKAPDGNPLPREILDPAVVLSDADLPRLIQGFLGRVDVAANPLLARLPRK
jgi:hypothetical protein